MNFFGKAAYETGPGQLLLLLLLLLLMFWCCWSCSLLSLLEGPPVAVVIDGQTLMILLQLSRPALPEAGGGSGTAGGAPLLASSWK